MVKKGSLSLIKYWKLILDLSNNKLGKMKEIKQ